MKKFLKIVSLIVTILFVAVFSYADYTTVKKSAGDAKHAWQYGHFVDFNHHSVRRIPVPLAGVMVDGTGPITSSSAPNLATTDNVAAITWDNSGETAEIQFPWYPSENFSAMSVKMFISSSHATGTDNVVSWGIFVHDDATAFASAVAQTAVTLASTTLDTKDELVTLTLDATGIAAITKGTSGVDIYVANGSTDNYTLEIKQIWIEETGGP